MTLGLLAGIALLALVATILVELAFVVRDNVQRLRAQKAARARLVWLRRLAEEHGVNHRPDDTVATLEHRIRVSFTYAGRFGTGAERTRENKPAYLTDEEWMGAACTHCACGRGKRSA